jgi:nucleotide-binding universal stress UspA family protein
LNVLVAYDASEGAEEALRFAARLTTPEGALTVLQVIDPRTDAGDIHAPTRTEAVAILRARLEAALQARLASMGEPKPEGIVVEVERGEDVAECIDRIAAERGVDAVAIASRQAAGLRGLALGSITQELLRISARPVVVVRA